MHNIIQGDIVFRKELRIWILCLWHTQRIVPHAKIKLSWM